MSYSQKAIVGYETNCLFIRGFYNAGYGNSFRFDFFEATVVSTVVEILTKRIINSIDVPI